MLESEPKEQLVQLQERYDRFMAQYGEVIEKMNALGQVRELNAHPMFNNILNNARNALTGVLSMPPEALDETMIQLAEQRMDLLEQYLTAINDYPDFMLQEATTAGAFPDIYQEAEEANIKGESIDFVKHYINGSLKRLKKQR